jgi:hypothetical protein
VKDIRQESDKLRLFIQTYNTASQSERPILDVPVLHEVGTEEPSLRGVVKFRVRVISYSYSIIEGAHVYYRQDVPEEAGKVWFKCDLVEEIKNEDGGYLRDSDFKHTEGVSLLQSVRNSIAPVERINPMITVQSTWHCPND